MWIQVTRKDNQRVLVNLAWVSAATPSANGSVLVFDKRLGDGKKLAVTESVHQLADKIGAPISAARRQRRGWE